MEEFKEAHSDRYDYLLVERVNNITPVKIICKEHGIFEQLPYLCKNGCGHSKCSRNKRKTTVEAYTQKKKAKEIQQRDNLKLDVVQGA